MITPEDMAAVQAQVLRARRVADKYRGRWVATMAPQGLAWHEAAELAGELRDLCRTLGWVIPELRNLVDPARQLEAPKEEK